MEIRNKVGLSNRPRVLHFIWWVPHYRVGIFRRLSRNPYLDFCVVAGDNSTYYGGAKIASVSDAGLDQEIHWRKVKSLRITLPILRGYEWQQEAVRIAFREPFDAAIVLGNKSLSNLLVRVICRLRGIPLLEWTLGVRRPESRLSWLARWLLYSVWPQAHLLYGNFSREWYARHGLDTKRLFVVRNSLDYERQKRIRAQFTDAQQINIRARFNADASAARLIVHLGRLEHEKRIGILLRGLSAARQRSLNIQLVIIGEGRLRGELEAEAQRLGVGTAAHFLGECYDEQVLGEIIMASDLCVAPGAVGLIAMHALVYGTPLLTCENTSWIHGPEIDAIIEGKTGGYHRENDVAHLAERMVGLLYPEPAKKHMESECRRTVDTCYTPEYQEQVIVEALNSVLPQDKQIPRPAERAN